MVQIYDDWYLWERLFPVFYIYFFLFVSKRTLISKLLFICMVLSIGLTIANDLAECRHGSVVEGGAIKSCSSKHFVFEHNFTSENLVWSPELDGLHTDVVCWFGPLRPLRVGSHLVDFWAGIFSLVSSRRIPVYVPENL